MTWAERGVWLNGPLLFCRLCSSFSSCSSKMPKCPHGPTMWMVWAKRSFRTVQYCLFFVDAGSWIPLRSVSEVRQVLENQTKPTWAFRDKVCRVKCCLFLGQADTVGKNRQAFKYLRLFSSHISKTSWLRERYALLLWNSYALFESVVNKILWLNLWQEELE